MITIRMYAPGTIEGINGRVVLSNLPTMCEAKALADDLQRSAPSGSGWLFFADNDDPDYEPEWD